MLGILEEAKTRRPRPLPQAAGKVGGISAGGICGYTNNYITEQNRNHKTAGTVAMEMCFKCKQNTRERTESPALQELKI